MKAHASAIIKKAQVTLACAKPPLMHKNPVLCMDCLCLSVAKGMDFIMELLPAIDLLGGKVVRLIGGDYDKCTIYSRDPVETALRWEALGAKNLHIVDLDGAREGSIVKLDAIARIASASSLHIEAGGGVRSENDIARLLNAGIKRVILGTSALERPYWLAEMAKKHPDAIAAGVDARNGLVSVKGWLETTAQDAPAFCAQLANMGIKTIIYTDIAKDGGMAGPNFEIYRTLCAALPDVRIIASGGVSSVHDLRKLKETGAWGAIVGRALYEGAIELKEAVQIC